jgi:hypothetical protein
MELHPDKVSLEGTKPTPCMAQKALLKMQGFPFIRLDGVLSLSFLFQGRMRNEACSTSEINLSWAG